MNKIQGQEGELRMTVEITRKDTGKVDVVELTSKIDKEDFEKLTDLLTEDK